uniref:Dynactin subunit 3 n=1 Tax=Chromera velia CCMP2878 TaxID=1169474 RepID=A0A0G4IE33_9ALVE|mmetsp:Transcript_36984/g.72738  ORF Transcript_36984/g.72738 Transcript_36984/m.72738 type:complete len:193 (+) Transcript_36984:198-776(+)|eukprot:Cvel_2387.t1-p1 / transcript=Cvel_2387.t1 / gene=Cvel_2387 / organism=Chromera_velia_CCMP2878 / gene_product=hypothetical protein / transcript_product=hypothetical protein / location=Cvel_scaffold92:139993-142092(-) / protein_length=192 / sequence_SO=supercontig / SO=protein_coding / is_pseudo=false
MNVDLDDLELRLASCESILGVGPDIEAPPLPDELVALTLREQVAKLAEQLNERFDGPILEFEKKYLDITSWLKAERGELSNVLLNTVAKRGFVLEHADVLRECAGQLQTVESLQQYVNPPVLKEMPGYAQRLELLEARGQALSESAQKLHAEVDQLASTYHQAISTMSALLMEWDAALVRLEEKRDGGGGSK